ncbi:MAG: tRNA preQ1(34) S-adenosylmethionine ribosyltransferase-isomerase QueA [Deltaproteobacteria bacterium 13_1_20CM_2_69_21]|nr:MAG: tRNA preQ1(34) S-adenosylmethionine ribosyltransferase-isomerase QueA [Deltaproteobacteria bacterium 13_1_40CM_3_69_14]OLD47173.1 MAG: tRNA preQ1(34) S-adenosylmethionine ribosyltransferase-isomerase QueA [Chloroflexi bacterium 13_1_40CM_2_68_14]OLE62643.1 MAG: tRNA preQ1(34) S-adenosylmethionine ribosyltransferase-isomerase QueA [Deltaproteobacteria bacterium 13_1_20CM_2_69_21]
MDVADFDYELPEELIAQAPLPERDASRLLVLPRRSGHLQHRAIRDLPELLRAGDLLVVNDARVIPARLHGRKEGSGGKVELLLIEPLAGGDWLALGQASKPLRQGARVEVLGSSIEIVEVRGGGELVVRLPLRGEPLWQFLDEAGELPLPPYIRHAPGPTDRERYQTMFARERGAVAAPTAGLHFTPALIDALRARGIGIDPITLHVGPGTFLPVRTERVEDHRMHRERYFVPDETARALDRAKRVIAVGTTALRTLEASGGRPGPGATDLFVKPGYEFRTVDGLLTNFHLPRSTLLMLVAAFAGLDRIKAAYREAIAGRYRFFSYGDAMLIA